MLHKIIETTFLCDVIEFSKLNTYSDAVSALRFLHPREREARPQYWRRKQTQNGHGQKNKVASIKRNRKSMDDVKGQQRKGISNYEV